MTTEQRTRVSRWGVAALTLAPLVLALVAVRPLPAAGQDPAFGTYALTTTAAGNALDGELGAGGGLATIDGGAPHVAGRVDGAPSTSVRASSVEPGTLVRTAVGLANTEAGETLLVVPTTAEAQHPGGPDQGRAETALGPEALGPWTTSAGVATATASQRRVAGRATVGQQTITGPGDAAALLQATLDGLRAEFPTLGGGRTTAEHPEIRLDQVGAAARAVADPVDGVLTTTGSSTVQTLDVFGELVLTGVTGRATVTVHDDEATTSTRMVVGGATLAGVPVEFDDRGVRVAGDVELLPGQAIGDLDEALNAALVTAGIRLEVLEPRVDTGTRFGEADSGGLRVTITTPNTPQVPGNDLTLLIGRAVVTASWEAPATPSSDRSGPQGPTPPRPGDDTAALPLPPTTAGPPPPVRDIRRPPSPPAQVAAPAAPVGPGNDVVVAGARVDRSALLAALGAWQFLSLSLATATAFAVRRSGLP